MSLFDWFFPEHAQTNQLKKIAEEQRKSNRLNASSQSDLGERLSLLENQFGFIALLLVSLVDKLDNGGVISREDLKFTLEQINPCYAACGVGSNELSEEELQAEIASGLGLAESTSDELDEQIDKLQSRLAELRRIKAETTIAE